MVATVFIPQFSALDKQVYSQMLRQQQKCKKTMHWAKLSQELNLIRGPEVLFL